MKKSLHSELIEMDKIVDKKNRHINKLTTHLKSIINSLERRDLVEADHYGKEALKYIDKLKTPTHTPTYDRIRVIQLLGSLVNDSKCNGDVNINKYIDDIAEIILM